MSLLTTVGSLISEFGTNAVLRERLNLLGDQVQQLEKKLEESEARVAELGRENRQLVDKLEKQSVPHEFFEYRSALWRKLPTGNVEPTVYCPGCKKPMNGMRGHPFRCLRCRLNTGFFFHELPTVLSGVTAAWTSRAS